MIFQTLAKVKTDELGLKVCGLLTNVCYVQIFKYIVGSTQSFAVQIQSYSAVELYYPISNLEVRLITRPPFFAHR